MRTRTRAQVRASSTSSTIDVAGFAAELNGQLDRFVRGVASEVANEVQVGGVFSEGTPLDTGFARANWDAAIGGEPAGGAAGGDETPDPEAAQSRVAEVIARWGADQPPLTVVNTAPYAIDLEAGHSGQAPNGMVGIAIVSAPQIADQVAQFIRQGVNA